MIFPSPLHNLIFFPNRLVKLPGVRTRNFIHPCPGSADAAAVRSSAAAAAIQQRWRAYRASRQQQIDLQSLQSNDGNSSGLILAKLFIMMRLVRKHNKRLIFSPFRVMKKTPPGLLLTMLIMMKRLGMKHNNRLIFSPYRVMKKTPP